MEDYQKFLPPQDLPAFHQGFWSSIKAHEAALQKCGGCATFRFIPMEICPKCFSAEYDWVRISGRGEVYTYTVIRRAPTPAYQADAPYVIAHVTMEEGPRMISNLIGIAPEDVKIGMQVRLVYEDVTEDVSLFKFEPA